MSVRETFGGRRAMAWAIPLAVVAANLVWLAAFGSGSRMREAELARRLERVRSDHAEVTTRLAEREQLWIAANENRDRLARLDREQFASERARFTDMVRELKQLAERAGLDPGNIGYPRESLVDYGLTRRSFVFSVEGSYGALRTFLHLVELTPSFLVVEQIDVGDGGRGLSIRLRLSTLFSTAAAAEEPVAAGSAGG
jgi:Tfp pilus assembly protein PilO